MQLRRTLRKLPGYQFLRRTYRTATEQDFRTREELKRWVIQGLSLQERFGLQPIIFRNGKAFVKSPNGIEYWWNPEIGGGTLDLEFGSDFEQKERECVLSFLSPTRDENAVFLDIGGNCGLFSLTVATEFPKAEVHCFEPVPVSQQLIRTNAETNALSSCIKLVPAAVGDQRGTVRMTASYSAMDHLIPDNDKHELSPLIIEVPMITLDDYAEEVKLRRVDFIKCDVEGAELLVCKGAKNLLKRFRPPIMLEIEPRHTRRYEYAPGDLDNFLRSLNYLPGIPAPLSSYQAIADISEYISRGQNNFLYVADRVK